MAMSALKRNCVRVSGRGRTPIVFSHGFGTEQAGWRRVTPRFEDHCTVVTLDLTGLGHSQASAFDPARYTSLHAHASDLLEVCDELGIADGLYVGHSMSGMVGVLAAIREPMRFRKLALIGASPCYVNEPGYQGGLEPAQVEEVVRAIADDYQGWYQSMLPIAADQEQGSPLVGELSRSFARVQPAIARHILGAVFRADHRNDLPELTTETLVLQAAVDAFVPTSVGQYLAKHVQHGTLQVLRARGGHFPHLGEPTQVADALQKFFAD